MGSAAMLPAVFGMLPDSFSAFLGAHCIGHFRRLSIVAPEQSPATCRRQRAECPRSPKQRKQTRRFCITSFLQLRESDLLASNVFRSVASPSSHSSFCAEV